MAIRDRRRCERRAMAAVQKPRQKRSVPDPFNIIPKELRDGRGRAPYLRPSSVVRRPTEPTGVMKVTEDAGEIRDSQDQSSFGAFK